MDKINIKEILRKQCYITKDDQEDIHDSLDNVSMAVKNICKKVLELAAENATIKVVEYAKHGGKIISESDLGQEISVDGYQQYYQCNKQSILDVINLIE